MITLKKKSEKENNALVTLQNYDACIPQLNHFNLKKV